MKKIVRQKKYQTCQAGFTLIEVLVAIAILTIGILAMMGMQIAASKGNTTANVVTNAVVNGANQVEEVFALHFDADKVTDQDGDGVGGLYDMDCATADYCTDGQDGYELYVNVAPGTPLQRGTKRVVVQAVKDRNGDRFSVPYEYIVSEYLQGLAPTN